MRPHEVHALARQAGLDHESAVVATAVAWPESGLNPAKEGDLTRVGEPTADGRRWGPSIGLWMVRSILEDRGTGSARDPEALHDPVHNARAMAEISHTGADFTPWTDFRNGAYVHYLARVREAVSMETWHPRAIRAEADPTHSGLSMLDVPPKIILHTTEIGGLYHYNSASYFGNPYWPHATIDAAGIHQHLPIDAGAYALYRGGVDTNRANAIQCEIMAYASTIEDLDDATLAHVADWVTWVSEQTGASLQVCPQGFHGQGEGMVLASEDSPIRFTDDEWLAFSGICGHQHIPSGNDHWDPGRFPVARCLGAPTEENDMFTDQDRARLEEVERKVLDLRAYMEDEKGGAQDTIAEVLAAKANEISAKIDKLKAGGGTVDVDALAEKVADKLAARLAQ